MIIRHLAIALLALGASACATAPDLNITQEAGEPRSEVALIVREVACEIATSPAFPRLNAAGYVVTANITIKARETSGVTPSLSFINPFTAPSTNQTTVVNGTLSRSGMRQFNQTLMLRAAEMPVMTPDQCPSTNSTSGLTGNVGLHEIIEGAFASGNTGVAGTTFVSGTASSSNPSFAATIEFVYERNINGGPNWTRVRFRGPNSSTGLANAGRTDTSTLVVTFVPIVTDLRATGTWSDGERLVAEQQSQVLLTQVLLQNATLGN